MPYPSKVNSGIQKGFFLSFIEYISSVYLDVSHVNNAQISVIARTLLGKIKNI